VLLAGGLGYLIGKKSGPFFAARAVKSARTSSRPARRAARPKRARRSGPAAGQLEAEIAALRAASGKEEEAEAGRFGRHTAAEIAKTQAQAEQEIVAAGKAARLELKRYCAELSVGWRNKKSAPA